MSMLTTGSVERCHTKQECRKDKGSAVDSIAYLDRTKMVALYILGCKTVCERNCGILFSLLSELRVLDVQHLGHTVACSGYN